MGGEAETRPAGEQAEVPAFLSGTLPRAKPSTPASSGLSAGVSSGRVRFRSPVLETLGYQFGGIMGEGRPLTPGELRLAKEVFGQSLDLDVVRIVKTGMPPNAPTTLGNSIRTARSMSRSTLVHELVHVWQFQNGGGAYISDSAHKQLHAMVTTGSRAAAYDLKGVVTPDKKFGEYSAEYQAMIVQTWYEDPQKRADPMYVALVDEMRRHRPLPRSERRRKIYEEGLFGPAGAPRHPHPLGDEHELPRVMPFLRIEW